VKTREETDSLVALLHSQILKKSDNSLPLDTHDLMLLYMLWIILRKFPFIEGFVFRSFSDSFASGTESKSFREIYKYPEKCLLIKSQ